MSRVKDARARLFDMGAGELAEFSDPKSGYNVTMWAKNGRSFLLLDMNDVGYNIFIPAYDGNGIVETFEALEGYLNG